MIEEVKNEIFFIPNIFNINSIIALNCIHLINK